MSVHACTRIVVKHSHSMIQMHTLYTYVLHAHTHTPTHTHTQAFSQYQDAKYVNTFVEDFGVEDEIVAQQEPFAPTFSRLMDLKCEMKADEQPSAASASFEVAWSMKIQQFDDSESDEEVCVHMCSMYLCVLCSLWCVVCVWMWCVCVCGCGVCVCGVCVWCVCVCEIVLTFKLSETFSGVKYLD